MKARRAAVVAIQWICLLTLVRVQALRESNIDQDVVCRLAEDEVAALLDEAARTWRVTDSFVDQHGLQAVVDCTNERDIISLQTTKAIQPSGRIVLPWNLTLRGERGANPPTNRNPKTSLTCPEKDGLFLIKCSLKDLVIQGCNLSEANQVNGIIETEQCVPQPADPVIIQLQGVIFEGNTNLGGSVGLMVNDPSCYQVQMQDVKFQSNQYTKSSFMSSLNNLTDVQLLGNAVFVPKKNQPFFYFPPNSNTFLKDLTAQENKGSILHVDKGMIDIQDSTFRENFAHKKGVIVASGSKDVSILSSRFEANTCKGNGAAVFLSNGSKGTFSLVHFLNNTAYYGGALHLKAPRKIELDRCVFESNAATKTDGFRHKGGAVFASGGGKGSQPSLNVSSCKFLQNSARQGGGAIAIDHWNGVNFTLTDSTFLGNYVNVSKNTIRGGAILLDGSEKISFHDSESVFESNQANDGGAVSFNEVSGVISFTSTSFTGNQACPETGFGGAVSITFSDETTVRLDHTNFKHNNASNRGGSIYATGAIDITITHSQFLKNQASEEEGGVIYVEKVQRTSIQNCTFKGNLAKRNGGSLLVKAEKEWTRVQILGSIFKNNNAQSGGAVYSDICMTVTDCHFEDNTAQQDGGAIAMALRADNLDLESPFSNVSFLKNTASIGGAVHIERPMLATMDKDCRFEENSAELYGGAIYVLLEGEFEFLNLKNSTLIKNKAKLGGGVFFQLDAEDEEIHSDIIGTQFIANYAEWAGGAYFTDTVAAVSHDCDFKDSKRFFKHQGVQNASINCNSMQVNSVGEDGYGADIATTAKHFALEVVYLNETRVFVKIGENYTVENWKSGEDLPIFTVVMMDDFYQAPALTRSGQNCKGDFTPAQFNQYTKATARSTNGLFPSPLVTNVSDGAGNISIGGPLQVPGEYELVFWIEDDPTRNITINVTLRSCIINEEVSLNGTLCVVCDSSHYNFDPVNGSCDSCPENGNCTGWGIAPEEEYWISSPCSTDVKECLSDRACKYDGRERDIHGFFTAEPTCNINETTLARFHDVQCHQGHKGLLCASCAADYGNFQFQCFHCHHKKYVIFWLLANSVLTAFICTISVSGNLEGGIQKSRTLARNKAKRIGSRHIGGSHEGQTIPAEQVAEIGHDGDPGEVSFGQTSNDPQHEIEAEPSAVSASTEQPLLQTSSDAIAVINVTDTNPDNVAEKDADKKNQKECDTAKRNMNESIKVPAPASLHGMSLSV